MVVLGAFHSMLVMKISWTELQVEVGYICRILNHGRWTIFMKEWAWNTLWTFISWHLKKGVAHDNDMFYFSPKYLRPIEFTREMSEMQVCSTRWGQLNKWAPPQILKGKWSHNRLATLGIGACELSHVSNYIYAKSVWKKNCVQKLH